MKKFVKVDQLNLVNGGYLSTGEENAPVTNAAFVAAQKRAEYVITFAKHAKNKDFKGKEADSIQDVRDAVTKELAKQKTQFVAAPEKMVKKLADQLAEEALKFMDYTDESNKVEKMNDFLAEFEIIHEFETFGLFFEDGIVKLNKIYTMEEIIAAVKETIDVI